MNGDTAVPPENITKKPIKSKIPINGISQTFFLSLKYLMRSNIKKN